MAGLKRLWVETYRPKTINDVIFQNETQKQQFVDMVVAGEIPHLLLSGVQGSGKTTISKALVNELDIDDIDLLTINASDENSVDVMREKIKNFAQGYSMGKFKVVQLEEMDFLSLNAQGALRFIMEEYSDTCRFICTCNYENKIIPALKSRLQHFHFKAPSFENVFELAGVILVQEEVSFDIDTLEFFISAAYPDIRKLINSLQQNVVNGELVKPDHSDSADFRFKLLDLIENDDFKSIRKLVCDNISKEEYDDMYRFLYENLHKGKKFKDEDKYESAIVLLANYLYRHGICSDPEINAAALFIELGML